MKPVSPIIAERYAADRAAGNPTEAKPRVEPVSNGPGGHLRAMLKTLGFKTDGCGGFCNEMAAEMNKGGVDWCRVNREKIRVRLVKKYTETTLAQRIKAGAAALWNGLPLTIDGLIDEAISRAESNDANTRIAG